MKVYPFSHFPPNGKVSTRSSLSKSNKEYPNDPLFINDAAFDWMYPEHFQLLYQHWTPLGIARKAAEFLAEPGAKVLDIGSGIGKFCLAAGHYFPETFFYGVEQRHELIYLAEEAKGYMKMPNVNFIYANITQINFEKFDHFYFFNSFHENINPECQIDDTIELSESLYIYYTQYLYNILNDRPTGTRLVTFHTFDEGIPPGYKLTNVSYDTLLKMWIKK